MNKKELHEKILYPVVRVRTPKAGGSGTIIYSKTNPDKPDEHQTFVLTNEHVVDDAITTKKEWDSLLKKQIEKEILAPINVDIFSYVYLSTVVSSNTHNADIIAYDKSHDIALLKLDSPNKYDYVAKLLPKEKIADIKLFTDCYACGCSVSHDAFASYGHITYLKEIIDNKIFWMSNAPIIFGNSGGAMYLAETGELIGIPARVTALQLGFGVDIVTFMGFFVAPQRLYEFFDEQCLHWLYDSKFTYKECLDLRKNKERRAKLEMALKMDETISERTQKSD